LLSHIPLGLLPHLGNKLWALRDDRDRLLFVKLAFAIGITLGMLSLAGLLARGIFDDALLAEGANPNQALPLLFLELFPTWLAALVGVGILCAIMSTADGLLVSSSQIVANDLYRRTLVPRLRPRPTDQEIDRRVLVLSRWSTAVILAACAIMAWFLIETNIGLIIWMGTGGMMAAFAGPLVMGALWRGVTRTGAYWGLVCGMGSFVLLHTGALEPAWFADTLLFDGVAWLKGESPNPFSCSAMGEIVSVVVTWGVSKLTQPLDRAHLDQLFGA